MITVLQKKLLKVLLAITLLLSYGVWGQAPVNLPATSPYSQNFNTTPGPSGTTYPQGWMAYDGTVADNSMTVATGTTTTGGNHNYGSKIGLLASGSYAAPLYIVFAIHNTAGKTDLKISYAIHKMREQGRTNSFNLEVSTTSATSGFTAVTGGSYDSGSLAQGTVTPYTNIDISALDNKNSTVWIRWTYDEIGGSGSRDGIALDDVAVSWTQAPVIPDAPMALPATAVTHVGFTANWSAVTGVDGYWLDVSTDADFTAILENYENMAVLGTSQSVTLEILPNTTYYYRLRAQKGAEVSANSNVIIVNVPQPPLPAPVATAATGILSDGFTANWEAVEGATGYYLDVSTNPDFGTTTPGVMITETFENMPAASASHTTTNWTGDGGIAWSAAFNRTDRVVTGTQDRLLCLFESSVAESAYLESGVITGGLTNLTFDIWKVLNNGTFSGVIVYVLTGENFETQTTLGTIDSPATIAKAVFNSGPITGITGNYKIRIEVLYSNNARTGINNLTFGADAIFTPVLITGYNGLDTGNVLTYNVTGLDANTTYYYRVRAYDATRVSANSNVIEVKTECLAVPLPEVTLATFCGSATVADLAATGTDLKWYAAAAPTVVLADTDALASGDYLITQTLNGCESDAVPFTVTINEIPATPVTEPLAFCGSAVAAELSAIGNNLKWYTSLTEETALAGTDAVLSGSYFVSQTVNGCESERTEVVVTINEIPVAPVTEPLAFCGSATVAELTVTTGNNLTWYISLAEDTALAETDVVLSGSYFVTQTVNGCESERAEVAVTVSEIPAAPATEPLTFCGSTTVADLTVTNGTGLKWYASLTETDELESTAAVTTGSYFVAQTVNGCESERAEVAVTVNNIPAAPTAVATAQTLCGPATVSQLLTGTETIVWYSSSVATDALAANAELTTGLSIYYAAQVVNGCESNARTAVAVMVNITAAPTAAPFTTCNAATVADLDANGTALKWYAAEDAAEPLESTAALVSGTYYVTQTLNSCESARVPVEVVISVTPMPVGAETQEYNEGQTLADLIVTGDGLVWYADEMLTEALPETTVLVNGETYYAVSVIGECASEPLGVTVDEVLSTGDFDAASFKYYPNPVKDVLNVSYSSTISSVAVYNLVGQQVLAIDADADNVSVDLSRLAAGTYILNVVAGGRAQTIKVIKE